MAISTAKHYEIILYVEDGWTPEKILSILRIWSIVARYAFILHDHDVKEDGTPDKPHYHLYINFGKSSTSIESVAKKFSISQSLVQKIKRNQYFVLMYFMHNNNPDKHSYPLENIYANFNVQEYLANYSQSRTLNNYLEECANGIITRNNYLNKIPAAILAKHMHEIENAFKIADARYLANNLSTESDLIWLYGESGTGKTTLAKMVANELDLSLYIAATGSDPFSKYADQHAVLLDELRPDGPIKYDELLQITDPHSTTVAHSRFHDKVLKAKLLIVSTVYSPEDFYRALCLPATDSALQLFRRISYVLHIERKSITILKFNIQTNCFEKVKVLQNPVPAYVDAQNASCNPASAPLNIEATLNNLISRHMQPISTVSANSTSSQPVENSEEAEELPFPNSP